MLRLIGIKKKCSIENREAMSINNKQQLYLIENLKEYLDSIIIVSTCNRTEIYIQDNLEDNLIEKKIFEILNWGSNLIQNTFILYDEDVVRHLFEVTSGFHSKIIGEEQILGQIKDAYFFSKLHNVVSGSLQRLFEDAISCGKKFRTQSKLYEIPVSSASIAVNIASYNNLKSIMVLGYGNIGSLVIKYCLSNKFEQIFIVTRNKCKLRSLSDSRIVVLDYKSAYEIINDVDCVVSCTASPHIIIRKENINDYGENIVLIDLALPRDIDKNASEFKRVKLYDIDDISELDKENRALRISKMNSNKYIVENFIDKFLSWNKTKDLSSFIKDLKSSSDNIILERVDSLESKSKNKEDIELAKTLIKSTSDFYVNNAIKLLREEKLKGRENECLEIIQKIFMKN